MTSLNFLSNYLFKAAGIGLPAYNQFLLNIQKVIPAMNSQGYYSKNNGRFQLYSDAEGQEAEALNQLEYFNITQYLMRKTAVMYFSRWSNECLLDKIHDYIISI